MLIVDLWRRMPGKYFCISTKSPSGTWADHYFSRDELDKVRSFLKRYADHDLYWCPHGLSKKSRKEEAAVPGKMLWADLDEADPRKIDPKPSIAIESSPGRFVGLWFLDQTMTKELNRQLTYHVKADKSGWDFGQVLRIPGTINYKYDSEPKVRTMWDDQPGYTTRQVKALVGSNGKGAEPSSHVASSVYSQYEKKLPVWLRRELLRKDAPAAGKRSEMIWKIEHALLEAGCTADESFVLVKASVWNKFKGRHNEDGQLRRELDKIRDQRFDVIDTHTTPSADYEFFAHPIDDAEEKNVDWIWRGRLARGELTIVEGDPGLGKSYVVQMMCRALCDGDLLPGMKPSERVKPSIVCYFDIENDQGSITKPRLIDNGLRNRRNFFQDERPFSIDDEEAKERAEEAIARLRPTLVGFDTLNNYIGSADIHKSSEAQQAMIWFRELARKYDCAVVVLRHLTKGGKEKALYRGQGSIAFAGAARIVLTVGLNPEDPEERVMAVTKMNLGPFPQSVGFRIMSLPDRGERRDRSKFEWGGLSDLTADDIVNVTRKSADAGDDRKAVEEFLRNVLGDGPMEGTKVENMAEKRGFNKRLVARVAEDIDIQKYRKGFGKSSIALWELPEG